VAITALDHAGRGIAKHEGKTIFVAGALPGERAEVRLTRQSSRFSEARLLQLLTRSERRQDPQCRHFGQCGGCQLQHMSSADQLAAKQQSVLDQLRRFANLKPEQLAEPLVAGEFGYRARARLGVQFNKHQALTLGFRRGGDKQLVALAECPVLQPPLQAVLAPLRHWLEHYRLTVVTHVELVATAAHCALVIRLVRPLPREASKALETLAQQHNWQVFLQPSSDKKALTNVAGQAVDPRLHYTLNAPHKGHNAVRIGFHPTDFTQVNTALNAKMVSQVISWLELSAEQRLWDLFCGVGNFSLPAAQVAGHVVGVEALEAMVARARENAAANGLHNLDFLAADLSQATMAQLLGKAGKPDAILLDPPRDGARAICQQLAELKRARIVYVSCNPATFARDARILVDGGYRLQRFGVMEMFAQTAHLETMALLVKA
jgi:23S rRNA (uracil1939-C5)-methyltransferase